MASQAADTCLPGNLASKYREYKLDTQNVKHWLVHTAVSHGFQLKDDEPQGIVRSARLKGKARAEAKKQPAAQVSSARMALIKVRDYVPMAELIASNVNPVPDYVQESLRRAIQARAKVASKLRDLDNTTSTASDICHQFFLSGKSAGILLGNTYFAKDKS